MIKLHYLTNGTLNLELENMTFGKHEKDPSDNVKSFICRNSELLLKADNINLFTDWGTIEIVPTDKTKTPVLNASIDSENWGWIATTQLIIEVNGEIIINLACKNF